MGTFNLNHFLALFSKLTTLPFSTKDAVVSLVISQNTACVAETIHHKEQPLYTILPAVISSASYMDGAADWHDAKSAMLAVEFSYLLREVKLNAILQQSQKYFEKTALYPATLSPVYAASTPRQDAEYSAEFSAEYTAEKHPDWSLGAVISASKTTSNIANFSHYQGVFRITASYHF